MASDKTEWPTEQRLDELRREGIVPYSTFSTTCMGAMAFVFALFLLTDLWPEMLEHHRALMRDPFSWERLQDLGDLALQLLFVPLIALITTALAWGLLQTRFLLAFHRVGFRIERISPFRLPHLLELFRRIAYAFGVSFFSVAFGLGLVFLALPYLLELFNHDQSYLLNSLSTLLWIAVFTTSTLFILLAIVTWVGARFAFRWNNRMSKQEVEHEVSAS